MPGGLLPLAVLFAGATGALDELLNATGDGPCAAAGGVAPKDATRRVDLSRRSPGSSKSSQSSAAEDEWEEPDGAAGAGYDALEPDVILANLANSTSRGDILLLVEDDDAPQKLPPSSSLVYTGVYDSCEPWKNVLQNCKIQKVKNGIR